MGHLKSSTGSVIELGSLTSIGRHGRSDVVLSDASVSSLHATISWSASGVWELRDAGSVNGTQIDGVRLAPGERARILVGAKLSFGNASLEMLDGAPPAPVLRREDTTLELRAHSGMFDLTPYHTCPATVVEHVDGDWWLEAGERSELLRDGDTFTLDHVRWRLHATSSVAATEQHCSPDPSAGAPLGGAQLELYAPPELETADLVVRVGDKVVRSHGRRERLLAKLVEFRLMDQEDPRIHPAEHGWVYADDLCTWLDLDSLERINVDVYRIRKHMIRNGVPNGASVVQRRRGTGQLRVGTHNISLASKPE
jgi:hypothetical protein